MPKKNGSAGNANRREFLKTTAVSTLGILGVGCTANGLGLESSAKPNVLFIFDDQHRHSALGCYGNDIVKTPNIDRFANEGLVFDNAFACSPICGPFRAQLQTGKYAHKNGVVDNEYGMSPGQTFLAHAFRKAGYDTGYIGKLHLGYAPYDTDEKRLGYDHMSAYNNGHNNYQAVLDEDGKVISRSEEWFPATEADKAISFMQEHENKNSPKPFFLTLSWGLPDWGYAETPAEFKTYEPADVDLPPNVPKAIEAITRREIADYYGCISALDAEFGRLMKTLDELNIANNTIVVFTSDHGDHLGSHGYGKPGFNKFELTYDKMVSKATVYNESIHIPFIIKFPKHGLKGVHTDSLISSVDMMPTLLGLCAADIPTAVQGDDLSHVVLGKAGPEKDSVYLQILGHGWPTREKGVGFWRGVRTKRWAYARWIDNNFPPLLFDCESDPYEMNNLAGKEDYAKIQQKLEDRLQRWLKETDNPFETGQRGKVKNMLMLGQKFTNKKWQNPN